MLAARIAYQIERERRLQIAARGQSEAEVVHAYQDSGRISLKAKLIASGAWCGDRISAWRAAYAATANAGGLLSPKSEDRGIHVKEEEQERSRANTEGGAARVQRGPMPR